MFDFVGHNRRALLSLLALIPAVVFSDVESDVVLIRSYVSRIEQIVNDIGTDSYAIASHLGSIDNKTPEYSTWNQQFEKLSSIVEACSRLTNEVFQIRQNSYKQLDVAHAETNYQERILAKLDEILYAQNSGGGFSSNILSMLTSFYGGDWPILMSNSSPQDQWNSQQQLLESGDFATLWGKYGLWRAFPMEIFSKLPSGPLGSVNSQYNKAKDDAFKAIYGISVFGPGHRSTLNKLAEPYYYLYGTKDITSNTFDTVSLLNRTLETISNRFETGISALDAPLAANSMFDTEGTVNSSTTGVIGRVGSSIASALGIHTPESPATNDVVAISSSDFTSNESTVKQDSINSSVTSCINTFNSSVRSTVDELFSASTDNADFVIEGVCADIIPGFEGVDITVPRSTPGSMVVVRWFIWGLRALCVVIFARKVMNKVADWNSDDTPF